MLRCFEHCNEALDSMKGEKFPDELSNHEHLKNDSDPWIYFVSTRQLVNVFVEKENRELI